MIIDKLKNNVNGEFRLKPMRSWPYHKLLTIFLLPPLCNTF